MLVTQSPDDSFLEIHEMIQKARFSALQTVNRGMMDLYWQIGRYLFEQAENEGWGKKVVQNLAAYLKNQDSNIQGFSAQNLWRMKQLYETYRFDEKLSPLVREISWTHNLLIIGQTKTQEERAFYLNLCLQERYSKRELQRQLDSAYYERTMLSDGKAKPETIIQYPQNLAGVFKDGYIFEFLDLKEPYGESDLQKSLLYHLKSFLLEIGKDFLLVGDNFRIQVGAKDFYIDILLYHRGLACLVAIELKITDFKPEYVGQLNFYLEALDRDVKKPNENPSIGILICASKDDEIVEYALSRSLSPTMVADYQTKLPQKDVLQAKLHELMGQLPTNFPPQ